MILYISHLNCVFRQIQLIRQLTPLWPGDVVFPQEFLLQPTDLLPAEGGPVPEYDNDDVNFDVDGDNDYDYDYEYDNDDDDDDDDDGDDDDDYDVDDNIIDTYDNEVDDGDDDGDDVDGDDEPPPSDVIEGRLAVWRNLVVWMGESWIFLHNVISAGTILAIYTVYMRRTSQSAPEYSLSL